ncbi:hypothetical protein CN374_15880 [Bacillus cereus]|nr:hypothetical protein CN374_15880 [Bacillus cereus]
MNTSRENYINDFSNISIINYNISTVRHEISIYRQRLKITVLHKERDCSKLNSLFLYINESDQILPLTSAYYSLQENGTISFHFH